MIGSVFTLAMLSNSSTPKYGSGPVVFPLLRQPMICARMDHNRKESSSLTVFPATMILVLMSGLLLLSTLTMIGPWSTAASRPFSCEKMDLVSPHTLLFANPRPLTSLKMETRVATFVIRAHPFKVLCMKAALYCMYIYSVRVR